MRAELVIAEPSAPVGRKRGGVYAFKHQVPVGIDKCAFALGIGSPQQEYQVFFLFCDLADNGIGESFPAFVLVRTGLVGPYGKRCIEQQYPLVRPAFQVARTGDRSTQVIVYFFKYILQGRRLLDTFGHGKTKAVRLSGTVVRILAEDNDFRIVYRTMVECIEYQFAGRENPGLGVFVFYKSDQFGKIRFVKFFLKQCFPGFFNLTSIWNKFYLDFK